jgi:hypothetical protein
VSKVRALADAAAVPTAAVDVTDMDAVVYFIYCNYDPLNQASFFQVVETWAFYTSAVQALKEPGANSKIKEYKDFRHYYYYFNGVHICSSFNSDNFRGQSQY